MKPNEWLFDAIGSVEDCYLAKAEKRPFRKQSAIFAAAACLCLLLIGGIVLLAKSPDSSPKTQRASVEASVQNSTAAVQVRVEKKEHTLAYAGEEESTDYYAVVLENYWGTPAVGESILIRADTESPLSETREGAVLLVLLSQSAGENPSKVFSLADAEQSVFTIQNQTAICVSDASAYPVAELVETLIACKEGGEAP